MEYEKSENERELERRDVFPRFRSYVHQNGMHVVRVEIGDVSKRKAFRRRAACYEDARERAICAALDYLK